MSQPRQVYSSEFKRETVELAATSGKSLRELECELGLSDGLLKQWVRKAKKDGEQAFPGHGRLKPDDEEPRRLRRENQILRQERDILKKRSRSWRTAPALSSRKSRSEVRLHRPGAQALWSRKNNLSIGQVL